MKNYTCYLLYLISCIAPGYICAQGSLKDEFTGFYGKMTTAPYYQVEAQIKVFDKEKIFHETSYTVKKKESAYFMKMSDSERIVNEDMIITMNEGFKVIMLSERKEETYDSFSAIESLAAIDSLAKGEKIEVDVIDSITTRYMMELPHGVYSKLVLTFVNGDLRQVVSYYSDKKAPYTHASLDLRVQFADAPSDEYFSIDRYASRSADGNYRLNDKYKDFELSLD